jgi:hypothetical protein
MAGQHSQRSQRTLRHLKFKLPAFFLETFGRGSRCDGNGGGRSPPRGSGGATPRQGVASRRRAGRQNPHEVRFFSSGGSDSSPAVRGTLKTGFQMGRVSRGFLAPGSLSVPGVLALWCRSRVPVRCPLQTSFPWCLVPVSKKT